MILNSLQEKKLITPPSWMVANTHYLTITGSVAYGCSRPDSSDEDLVGWCIPPKNVIFPHLSGEIEGFGKKHTRFSSWQEHHVCPKDSGKSYDLTVYGVVTFFQLCMGCNPNMLDVLFSPRRCVKHCTRVAEIVRHNRKLFLSSLCFPKFRGYSYSQIHKMKIKTPKEGSKRSKDVENHGFDTKFAYNVIRLLLQCEQILTECDLDLERNSEILKSVRRGDWTEDQILSWFSDKERGLETMYANTKLPRTPDEDKIKELLLQVMEEHYGSLQDAIVIPNKERETIDRICEVLKKSGYSI